MGIVDVNGEEVRTEIPVDDYLKGAVQLATKIRDMVSDEMINEKLTFMQTLGAVSMFHSQLTATLLEGESNAIRAANAHDDDDDDDDDEEGENTSD